MARSTGLFACVLFCAMTTYLAYAFTEEQKEKIHAFWIKESGPCIKDFPITKDDIENFKNNKMGTSEHAACFNACILKKSGVMTDEGLLESETAMDLAKDLLEDPDELQNIENFLNSCLHVNNATIDGEKGWCERGTLAFYCMVENASKFGIDI